MRNFAKCMSRKRTCDKKYKVKTFLKTIKVKVVDGQTGY